MSSNHMHDADALRCYSQTHSPDAFATLVRTHIDLVYTAARRQTRDPHLADDITQAVFIVLSKKARTISDPAHLAGWLIRTTRYAAYNAIRMKMRRRRHETQAAMKSNLAASIDPGDDASELTGLLPELDEHLARLSDADRTAITLRYFQNKPVRDIAAALNVSEVAAQKRVVRALEKLRTLFARHRLVTSTDAMGAALTALPLLHSPPALTPMILSATAAPNVILIVKGALHSMFWTSTKLAATTTAIIASLIIAASASVLLLNNKQVAASQPSAAGASASANSPATSRPSPQFPNVLMGALQSAAPGYTHGIDNTVRRTPDSDPAAVIMSTVANPSMGSVTQFLAVANPYHGQRVRVSGYLKTENVAHWAGLQVIVMTLDGRFFAYDNMSSRPITGTTDWKRYDSVLDVPPQAQRIALGVALYHTGKVWADGFTITPVGKDVPLNDDSLWHSFSSRGGGYAAKLDPATRRNAHPTTQFASTSKGIRLGDWGGYDHAIRNIEPYLGKRVRMTVWLKCQGVTQGSGPHIRVFGANFTKLTDEGQKGVRPMRGTMDWKKYEAIADVPQEAQVIYPGITLNGSGTIWMDEVKVQVVP